MELSSKFSSDADNNDEFEHLVDQALERRIMPLSQLLQ